MSLNNKNEKLKYKQFKKFIKNEIYFFFIKKGKKKFILNLNFKFLHSKHVQQLQS